MNLFHILLDISNLFVCFESLCDINEFENISIYQNFFKYLVKMDQKSAKIIDSNLRNVTKAEHVPKRDMCSECEFASNIWFYD